MKLRLDADAVATISLGDDGVCIGVWHISSGDIQIFRAGESLSLSEKIFPGHAELLAAGVIRAVGVNGFSFEVRAGKVRVFYRNSILNLTRPFCSITNDEMDRILEEIALPLAEDFNSFP